MFKPVSLFWMDLQIIKETNLFVKMKLKFSHIRIETYV